MATKVFVFALVSLAVPVIYGQFDCIYSNTTARIEACAGEHSYAVFLFKEFYELYSTLTYRFLDMARELPDQLCRNSTLMEGAMKALPCVYEELRECRPFYLDQYPREDSVLKFINGSCQMPNIDRYCFLASVRSDRVDENCKHFFYGSFCEQWSNLTSCVGADIQKHCSDNLFNLYNMQIAELSVVDCLPASTIDVPVVG
ncbi:uncharacterized protein LOC101860562 [Aplysia californica]|uniref:Uncharacterized protein LOC101860562 n=1 Tax=Aplysia californica TaxID=6500 RepID=A0ABM0JL57_APLCA|nr:uncharacterized protein LOC101860562 [Aplysia californica]